MTERHTHKPKSFLSRLGPGLITGAADDDPSGIGTHSQVGAEFGYGLAWTFVFSFPLMVVIQEVAAQIGRVTGRGIAANVRRHYPRGLLFIIVSLLLIANVINLGADLSAMGAALQLLIGSRSSGDRTSSAHSDATGRPHKSARAWSVRFLPSIASVKFFVAFHWILASRYAVLSAKFGLPETSLPPV